MQIVSFFLSIYLSLFGNFYGWTQIKPIPPDSPITITLPDLVFETDSDQILSGEKQTQKLIANEFSKNTQYTDIEIIYCSYLKKVDEKQKKLSIMRVKKIRDILIKTQVISLEKIKLNVINKKPKKKELLDSYTVEIKFNFNKSSENNIKKLFLNKNKKNKDFSQNNKTQSEELFLAQNDDLKLQKEFQSMLEEKKVTKPVPQNIKHIPKPRAKNHTKPVNIDVLLREPDILIITVKNKDNNTVDKFSKKIEKKGLVTISVPTDDLLPGKYKISIIGINGTFTLSEIEKK